MVCKIQDSYVSCGDRVYHLYKSVSFTEKRPRRPETGTKEGFKGMEYEFLFGIFHPEKQATFSVVSLFREIFRCNDPRGRVPFTFQPGFTETF